MLRVEDYVIVGLMMVVSTALGLYYSMIKQKQSSTMEYFLASRNMGVPSMALSFLATIIATGTMIGFPVEIYYFGSQLLMYLVAMPFIIWVNNQLVIPIFHSLKTPSIFKYFEIRFNRSLACAVAAASLFSMLIHGSVTLYGTAIALEDATKIRWDYLAYGMAVICIFYSTMGGIRGIIITDAVQALIILISVVILIIMGIIKINDAGHLWDLNHGTGRIEIINFDVDPRTRHTFWTSAIGYSFILISATSTSQSFIQRFLVAPNIKKAQCANTVGNTMMAMQMLLCGCLGLVIFSYYNGCDVVKLGLIKNPNQLVSMFAMSIFSQYYCLNGIYFGALVCASLSTISSALNSTSAVIIETFVRPAKPSMTDKTVTVVCKIVVLAAGIATLLGTILISQFQNILQASIAILSIISAPLFALYLIGVCFPQANTKLATASFLSSILFSLWIVTGNMVLRHPYPPKPFLTDNCDAFVNSNATIAETIRQQNWTSLINQQNYTFSTQPTNSSLMELVNNVTTTDTAKPNENWYATLFPLSTISYNWYAVISVVTTLVCFGILTSIFTSNGYCKPSNLDRQDLVPDLIQRLHLKLNPKMRRMLLCDIYEK